MTIGYKNPPRHSRFKKGVCPNPLGRGARKKHASAKAVEDYVNETVSFREGGKAKRATRAELSVKRLVASALGGNVKDAGRLLVLRERAVRSEAYIGDLVIKVEGGLPDQDG